MAVAAAPRSRAAPASPAEPEAPSLPRGASTTRPQEPAGSLNAELGRHLELLGRALQLREMRCPPAPGERRRGAAAAEDGEASLRDALEGKGPQLLEEMCSSSSLSGDEHPGVARSSKEALLSEDVATFQLPPLIDGKRVEEPTSQQSWSDREGSASPKRSAGTVAPRGGSMRARGNEVTILRSRKRRSTKENQSPSGPDIVASLAKSASDASGASRMSSVVTHPYFETAFAILLVLNVLVMILEEQYRGSKAGHEVRFYEYYGSDSRDSHFALGSEQAFDLLECVFTATFALEAVLRMAGRGRSYWRDPYDLLELFVVVCSIASILLHSWAGVKLIRTAKVLRMVKLIRRVKGLDSLHLMTTALSASGYALLWAGALLFLMQSVVALVLTNFLRGRYLLPAGPLDAEQKAQLFEYFGTYTRSMLSMFELTLANWPPICRFLTENLHEGWMVFAVLYKLSFGFAVVGVINAVFVQETFNVAATDDFIMVRRKQRAANVHRKKMERLFQRADADGSGQIDARELRQVLRDRSIQTWLESMDLDASNSDLIFQLVKKEGGDTITVDELIRGVARLKGPARSIDVQMVIRALREAWVTDSGCESLCQSSMPYASSTPCASTPYASTPHASTLNARSTSLGLPTPYPRTWGSQV